MTEAEWLACAKVTIPVLNWLRRRGSGRQFYLTGCAALRHIFHALPDDRFQDLVALVDGCIPVPAPAISGYDADLSS